MIDTTSTPVVRNCQASSIHHHGFDYDVRTYSRVMGSTPRAHHESPLSCPICGAARVQLVPAPMAVTINSNLNHPTATALNLRFALFGRSLGCISRYAICWLYPVLASDCGEVGKHLCTRAAETK